MYVATAVSTAKFAHIYKCISFDHLVFVNSKLVLHEKIIFLWANSTWKEKGVDYHLKSNEMSVVKLETWRGDFCNEIVCIIFVFFFFFLVSSLVDF